MSEVFHLDSETLMPIAVSKPCPSTAMAYLGVPGLTGVRVRCGRLIDHQGLHVFHVEWRDPAPTHTATTPAEVGDEEDEA